ncbi:hypothetical protein BHE74_00039399 [Ensete ventricosum]|nr:hypothetical protein BHE74_00039399 [Ensete ventricosum]RZS15067.1 hypothetical protein BHM03_00046846 [Ensete ventricosum]
MTEENKSLVAYVEDLYEDLRANNMVVVRWFHKADEVGIVLPPDINDREIFFSLCLQDFSVECIDGLASVLSAQHFEQFQNETRHSNWRPYMCRRQIDNDDVKPFDITQLQGYWSQQLLRSMFTSPVKLRLKITRGGSVLSAEKSDVFVGDSRRNHQLHYGDIQVAETTIMDMQSRGSAVSRKTGKNVTSTLSGSAMIRKKLFKQKLQRQLYPGCQVEVLSQDSGLRGCWFRCVIIKRHQDRVKVRYQDILDPEDGGNTEEWVSLSRVAAPDELGIHCERTIVRPHPPRRGKTYNFDVDSLFSDTMTITNDISDYEQFTKEQYVEETNGSSLPADTVQDETIPSGDSSSDGEAGILDLTKDSHFNKLKWKRKRRREQTEDGSSHKKQHWEASSSGSQDAVESSACGGFVLPKSLTVDHENCKIGGDPLFNTPMAISSLVMSQ